MHATANLVLSFAWVLSAAPAAGAEGGPVGKDVKGGVFPEVADASAEDAKRYLDALKGALATRDEGKIVQAVSPMVTKRHKDFVPELKKLLADRRDAVAAEAAMALGSQGDRTVGPLLQKLLAANTREKGFLRDPETKCAVVESLGRLGEVKAGDAVLELATAMRREPEVTAGYAKRVVRACVRCFGLLKEKDAVSFLIDEVEQPTPKDPNSSTNPGVDYWKARYAIWAEIRPEVLWALKEITGKEFETARRWENWFKEEGKKAGFK